MKSWKSFVVDHGRGSAAVAVLIVLPFAQLFQSRIAPVFVGVAILIIAVALLVTGRFKLQEGLANAVSDIRKNWALLASFFAIVVYAAVSAMWAPDRTLAIKSALTLALLPICVAILSHQFHLIPFVRLPVVLLLGCLSASIALTAPYFFQVQWFAFMGREAELFDLNRIAVLLAGLLFCVPLIRLETQNWRIAKAIIVVLGIVAIFRSESEVAKISALAFVLTFGVLYLLPRLTQVLVGSAIFLFCAFPMLVPLILILMTITGAVYPAIDLTAGERERGTLEALIASPVPRQYLLLAKYIAVVTVALLTAIVNLGAMSITLYVSGLGPILFGDRGLSWINLVYVFGLTILFAAFFSAVLLAVTSFARSFKEAQAYLIPLMLLSISPGVMSLMPELSLNGILAITPLVNIALLAREVLDGKAEAGPTLIVLGSTACYALLALWIASRVFGTDAILYASNASWTDLFRRRRGGRPERGADCWKR